MALWPQAIVFILFCYGFGAVGHCGAWHLKFSIDSPDLNASWVPGNNNRLHLPEIRVQALGPPSISIHGRKQRIPKRWSVPKFEVLALNEASKLPWKMHVSWKKLREESRHLYQGFAPVPASVSDLHFPAGRSCRTCSHFKNRKWIFSGYEKRLYNQQNYGYHPLLYPILSWQIWQWLTRMGTGPKNLLSWGVCHLWIFFL